MEFNAKINQFEDDNDTSTSYEDICEQSIASDDSHVFTITDDDEDASSYVSSEICQPITDNNDSDDSDYKFTKDNSYQETLIDGQQKFRCLRCERIISSKQRIKVHLSSSHNLSPIKRLRKVYLDNPEIEVPDRTARRCKRAKYPTLRNNDINVVLSDPDHQSNENNHGNKDSIKSITTPNTCVDADLASFNQPMDVLENDGDLSISSSNEGSLDQSYSSTISSSSTATCSDNDCASDSSTRGHVSDKDSTTSACEDAFLFPDPDLNVQETQALKLLSCFLRNTLYASASKDIIDTLKQMFPESIEINRLNYENIWKYIEDSNVKEFHFCTICSQLFPENVNAIECESDGCEGLRYEGSRDVQMKPGRHARLCFVFADIKSQLSSLLQSPGIWKDIMDNKHCILERTGEILTDITDGSSYRNLLKDGNFLSHKTNITSIFNTDGVNLYSSSKVELWPIFLSINELSPSLRFSRDNIILVGIWQGKGKPPFEPYMNIFCSEMNVLFDEGIRISTIHEEDILVKMAVLCGTVDLPAKACLLNMTYYNGKHACIACEEGQVVQQGRGTARCYPYRLPHNRPLLRNEENVRLAMERASERKRIVGFRGKSGLLNLKSLNIVNGMLPDYMHCVLLGATKTLLYKWFSSTESGKDYFIGKKLKQISNRLCNIKPPENIERLPRDIEKHYSNFKATELQSWLLYYGIPCMVGILPDVYLEHFASLSEGIYIIFGDHITEQHLHRAELLLDNFYNKFEELYPRGSCGLNIHNIGAHLVDYVRQWGPLWAWSCFAFEDSNAAMLKAAHGTGNVTKQVMRIKHAQCLLRKLGQSIRQTSKWRNMKKFGTCLIAGSVHDLQADVFTELIMTRLSLTNLSEARKAYRALINGDRFIASEYTRMKRRKCDVILLKNGNIATIVYFVVSLSSEIVYAAIMLIKIRNFCSVHNLRSGRHLIPVTTTQNLLLINVNDIESRLMFINTTGDSDKESPSDAFVAKFPNKHGHSVFK